MCPQFNSGRNHHRKNSILTYELECFFQYRQRKTISAYFTFIKELILIEKKRKNFWETAYCRVYKREDNKREAEVMCNDEKRVMNEKATIQAVKLQLQFLAKNAWMLGQDHHMVEDSNDLMDFISYTRSVITVPHDHAFHTFTSPVIEAMRRQENMMDYQKQKQQELLRHMTFLVRAIDLLPQKEKRCISMKYMMHAAYLQIAREMEISFSTVGRTLRRAYLHLAQLLQLEVYEADIEKEKPSL